MRVFTRHGPDTVNLLFFGDGGVFQYHLTHSLIGLHGSALRKNLKQLPTPLFYMHKIVVNSFLKCVGAPVAIGNLCMYLYMIIKIDSTICIP